MACVDSMPQSNLFEDETSSESMITLQHPQQDTGDGNTEDATHDAEEATSKASNSESRMNGMDEESMDDSTQNLSFRRCKLVILSDDDDDDPPRASVTSDAAEDESTVGQRKMRVIGSDSESDDDSFLFNSKPDPGKPKVVFFSALIFLRSFLTVF